jgi:hypothetical protein
MLFVSLLAFETVAVAPLPFVAKWADAPNDKHPTTKNNMANGEK